MKLMQTLVLICLGLSILNGCSFFNGKNDDPGTIRVKIPLFDATVGSYSMQTVEITTLKNIETLNGEAADLLLFPNVKNGTIQGQNPRAVLKRSSQGEYLASDQMTLKLMTLYYHFEKLMDLDTALEIKNLNTWPRKVAVDAKGVLASGEIEINQAKYISKFDAFAFYPYRDQATPLTINAGVLGHEHFHSFFDKLVLERNQDLVDKSLIANNSARGLDKTRADKSLVWTLRAINEGLADVWGWIYSGQTNFVAESLPEFGISRKLTNELTPFPNAERINGIFNTCGNQEYCLYQAYDLGSLYARFFVQFMQSENLSQVEKAKRVIEIVNEISEEIKKNEKFDPESPIKILRSKVQNLTPEQCELLSTNTNLKPESCNH